MSARIPVRRKNSESGFSLPELLLVVGIIVTVLAIAVPNIMEYLRTARIRAAANSVAAALQEARQRAISRNVRFGVLLVTRSATEYQWVVEDDMIPPISAASRGALSTLVDIRGQASNVQELPSDVTFDLTGASTYFVRFDAYGRACDPSGCTSPNLGSLTVVNAVRDDGSSPSLKLVQATTGFTRTLRLSAGGRVLIE
jgi:prepilin-type N-terminal cleavage/methylation domain-containing protein